MRFPDVSVAILLLWSGKKKNNNHDEVQELDPDSVDTDVARISKGGGRKKKGKKKAQTTAR